MHIVTKKPIKRFPFLCYFVLFEKVNLEIKKVDRNVELEAFDKRSDILIKIFRYEDGLFE